MDQKTRKLLKRYRVTKGKKFRLSDIDPGETRGYKEDEAKALLKDGLDKLSELQERLYAQNTWALLLILQGMDASGKDSAIEHVMSGVNPQGCQVYSFKVPNSEELEHDYLWRTTKALPERGRIGIFNRSYYEEVLIVRVHEELLDKQHLPEELISTAIWSERYEDIAGFERHLARNGIAVCKFFFHLSQAEQRNRFIKRLETPSKHWKFSAADVDEGNYWNDYMEAYEDAIRNTAAKHAPWFVVPADNKWFARLVVAGAIIDKLEELDPEFPKMSAGARKQLASTLAKLRKEKAG